MYAVTSTIHYGTKYLCIPATSVPGCAFSTTRNFVNAKHSCLLPENINILTLLAQNMD